jgi:light-regulated signal transduction histidine kinase (bacteriophytochrome)
VDPKFLLLSAAPLVRESGRVTGAMAILLDVTERVQAQRDLEAWSDLLERRVAERTAELVATNEELEGFCASVSHDLRSPLRAIDGFSKALLEDYSDKLDADGLDHLMRVRAAAWRMSELIDDLLGLTRLTRAPLHRVEVDLCAVAADVAKTLRSANPDHQVEFECDSSAVVYGDYRQLRRLVETLLENAWKFTSKIESAKVRFSVEEYDDETIYSVSDNGAGFDMTFVGKLFKPFERLHRAVDFPGNGIGLATAHRVVTRHGGRIWAEGAPNQGAVIRFTLDAYDISGRRTGATYSPSAAK